MASEDSLALPLLPSDRAIVVPAKIWAPHNFVTMTQCLPPTQIANNSIWGMFKPTLFV